MFVKNIFFWSFSQPVGRKGSRIQSAGGGKDLFSNDFINVLSILSTSLISSLIPSSIKYNTINVA